MAKKPAEIYTYFNTYANLLLELTPGQRGFTSDTKDLVWVDENSDVYFTPFNRKVTLSTDEYLDLVCKESICDKLNTNTIRNIDMPRDLYITELDAYELNTDFSSESIIGGMNELMNLVMGGSTTNYWYLDNSIPPYVELRPIDLLNVTHIYVTSGFKNLNTPDIIPLGEEIRGETFDVLFAGNAISILGALNYLVNEIDDIDNASALFYYDVDHWDKKIEAFAADLKTSVPIDFSLSNDDYLNFKYKFKLYSEATDKITFGVKSSDSPVYANLSLSIGTQNDNESNIENIYIHGTNIYLGNHITMNLNSIIVYDDVDFQTTKWEMFDWECEVIDTYRHMLFVYSDDGVDHKMRLGSKYGAVSASNYLDDLVLAANSVYIENPNYYYDLFDVISFSAYPGALYYGNDPGDPKIYTTSLGLSTIGMINWVDYYASGGYDIALRFNYWEVYFVEGYVNKIYFTSYYTPCTNFEMYFGTPPWAVSDDDRIHSFNVLAEHFYIQKSVGGTVWDLFDYVQGGVYPTVLYNILTETRLTGTALGVDIDGQLVWDSFIEDTMGSASDRFSCLVMDAWRLGFLEVSGSPELKHLRLEVIDPADISVCKLSIGTKSEESSTANWLPEINLRAKAIYVTDGVSNINLLTLSSGSGLSKTTRAYMSGSQSLNTTTETLVKYTSETYDDDSAHSTSTGKFTAVTAGIYIITASLNCTLAAAGTVHIRIYKNSTQMDTSAAYIDKAGTVYPAITTTLKLSVSDTVEIRAYQDSGYSSTIQTGGAFTITH